MIGGVQLTPQLMAQLFWEMYSDEKVEFFAALDDVAGYHLCMQMSHVVNEIADRGMVCDYRAQNAFQTMLAHAENYAESAAGWRAMKAKVAISGVVRAIKGELQ